ncbi:MAG TPA: sensor domain-containing diguanylate cyclase, partial [bacterium]|nr:sensor domain-containing diguanylate cyclase [bacterium]
IVHPSAGGFMAKRHPQKQSLLQKALLEKKVLTQEVLMYQHLMEVMRDEHSFDEILKVLIKLLTKGLGYDRAGIFLADWEIQTGKRVIGINLKGNFEESGEEYPLSPVRGTNWLSDLVHGYSKAFFTNNLLRKVKKIQCQQDTRTICNALTPIIVNKNEIIGVIAVDNLFTQRRLKKSDLTSLINFATEAGLAIQSFRLHEKIREMTFKDGLTGVYNRRYFDNYLPREVLRCARYKRHLSLIYVDLDYFKKINDLHGHPAGDLVLKQVAERLGQGLRNVDIVARMGGDEFAVILPEVGEDGLRLVANRLFKSITEIPMPLEQLGFPNQNIGVSMGITVQTETQGGDFNKLIRLADESLYKAKKAGRNRVGDLIQNSSEKAPSQ